MLIRIRGNSQARNALAVGIIWGLVGCQHLDQSRLKPPEARDSHAEAGQGLGAAQPPDLGGKLTPAQEADVQIAFGRAAERRGDLDQAMSIYRDALARDGQRADAYVRLAILHDRQGRFQESADHYQKALQLRPGDPEIYCDKGYSLYMQRHWSESEMILRQTLAINPSLPRAHNNLALVLAHTNRPDEALAEFRNAGSGIAEAESNLAFALTMDRHWQSARAHYKRAIALDPSSKTIQARLQQLDATVARLEQVQPGSARDESIVLASASIPLPKSTPGPTPKPSGVSSRPDNPQPAKPANSADKRTRPPVPPSTSDRGTPASR